MPDQIDICFQLGPLRISPAIFSPRSISGKRKGAFFLKSFVCTLIYHALRFFESSFLEALRGINFVHGSLDPTVGRNISYQGIVYDESVLAHNTYTTPILTRFLE